MNYYTTPVLVLTGFIRLLAREFDAMCHCFTSVEDTTEEERAEVLEGHSTEELRAEYSSEELDALGVST